MVSSCRTAGSGLGTAGVATNWCWSAWIRLAMVRDVKGWTKQRTEVLGRAGAHQGWRTAPDSPYLAGAAAQKFHRAGRPNLPTAISSSDVLDIKAAYKGDQIRSHEPAQPRIHHSRLCPLGGIMHVSMSGQGKERTFAA